MPESSSRYFAHPYGSLLRSAERHTALEPQFNKIPMQGLVTMVDRKPRP